MKSRLNQISPKTAEGLQEVETVKHLTAYHNTHGTVVIFEERPMQQQNTRLSSPEKRQHESFQQMPISDMFMFK